MTIMRTIRGGAKLNCGPCLLYSSVECMAVDENSTEGGSSGRISRVKGDSHICRVDGLLNAGLGAVCEVPYDVSNVRELQFGVSTRELRIKLAGTFQVTLCLSKAVTCPIPIEVS